MSISRRRLKTASIGVAMAIGLSTALPEKVEAQDRTVLFENDWKVAVEQDKLAIQKGCIEPEQRQFLINYTEMAGEGIGAIVGASGLPTDVPFQNPDEKEGNSLIAQLLALPDCSHSLAYNPGVYYPPSNGLGYLLNGGLLGLTTFSSWIGNPLPMILDGTEIYEYFTLHFYDDDDDYYGSDQYRRNLITGLVEVNYDESNDDVWYKSLEVTSALAYFGDDSWSYKEPPSWIVMIPSGGFGINEYKLSWNDSATLNELPSSVRGTVGNFSYNSWSGLWESFHAVKAYFGAPNDSSSLGGRSWGVQDYGTPKDSKAQEAIQDPKIVPAKENGIAPGLKPAATSVGSTRDVGGGFFERKRELLEDAKGVSGTGSSPAATGGRRQELLDEAKLTPSSGNASGIGSDHKQGLLEGSKGNSFNTKNSLEEKSFKNSIGEKSSGSKFTSDKMLSQRGTPNSFAPMVGKTHTFSGMGTKPPMSGKSFKMHGF